MVKIFKKLKTDTLALPSKVVYYNNMNGVEYSTINVEKREYNNSTETITTIDDFVDLGAWGEATTVRLMSDNLNLRRGFVFQDTSGGVLDNGFGTCKSLTLGGWFNTMQMSSIGFERFMWCQGASLFGVWRRNDGYLAYDMGGTSVQMGHAIDNDTWTHLAMSIEEINGTTTMKVYVNSALVKTHTVTYKMDFKSVQIGMGKWYSINAYTKNIFATKGALTEEEIRQMMLRD